jgi:hypothetical protein
MPGLRLLMTVLCAALCESTACRSAAAQTERDAYWATLGIGTGTLSSTSTAGAAGVWYRTGSHVLGARFLGVDTGGDPFEEPLPFVEEAVSEQAILYGRGRRGFRTWWFLAAGVAHLTWHRETTRDPLFGPEERERASAIGFPIEAQLFWTPSTRYGGGIAAFANLNRPRSFGGALVTVYFGRLR